MLDPIAFIERLEVILQHYELSSSEFAALIQVQRSSISHLLKGRNKPSLEFVMKINEAFPEVDFKWLLYGKGHFPKGDIKKSLPDNTKENTLNSDKGAPKKTVERIIIFYTDGTFKNYMEQ